MGIIWSIMGKLFFIFSIFLSFQSMAETPSDLKLGLKSYFGGDFVLAHEYLSLSAKTGNGEAQYLLGHMYEHGEGVEIDQQKSFLWYLASAKNSVPPAQYSLSLKYSFGIGTRKDVKEGLFWLEEAARPGHDYAQFKLGLDLIANGEKQKGLLWLRIASLANVQDAQKAYSQFAPLYSQGEHSNLLESAKVCIRSSYKNCTPEWKFD